MPTRPLHLPLVVVGAPAALLLGVTAATMIGGWGGSHGVRTVDDLSQGAAAALGGAAAVVASRRHRGRQRQGWAVLALGLALWASGQGLWCWWEIGQGRPAPFPSLADAGFLGFSLCATVAVCLLAGSGRNTSWLPRLFDGLVVAGALLIVSWCTALGATVHAGGGHVALLVSLAYPVTDIILLTTTVQMMSQVTGPRSSLVTLGAAAVALAVADSSFTYLSALGRYHTGDPLDLGWIGGFGLMAVAASSARPAKGGTTPDREVPRTRLIFLPYAVLLLAAAVMTILLLGGRRMDTVEACLAIVVVVLVLVRQYLAVRDNQVLVRTVEAREAQLSFQAFHDDLTGLPNRALFQDRVAHALELHREHGRPLAVLFCDLDDFKVINDTLGHLAGDDLLRRVGERLRGTVTVGDTLSRLGGDEFAILVEGHDPLFLAGRVEESLRAPFSLEGRSTAVRASVGIRAVAAGEATPTPSALLSDADTAMYSAKRSGKAAVAVYDPRMRLTGTDDLGLHQDLTDALASGRVDVVFQPVVEPATGRVHALEALARWSRRDQPVAPDVFVPLAERLGLIEQLTDHMLDTAVAQLERWSILLGHHDLKVTVNVSATELGHERFTERIAAVLSRYAVSSGQLVLEITESAVAAQPELAGAVLRDLVALGVHIALDDFGAGQSSLSRLQEFPIDYLKLDGAMVGRIDSEPTQARIVASINELGHHLGMLVVAEAVETPEQLATLCAMAEPPLIQGYLAARPAPAAELTARLVDQGTWPGWAGLLQPPPRVDA